MSELNPSSTLQKILNDYRKVTHTQRDSGTLFEELMIKYFENEPKFESEYKEVLTYADWADKYADELGLANKKDTGIDLVATNHLGEHHAIQCKNYVPSHKMAKSDIDSFMSASGKSYFSYRIVISTVDEWTDNATQMVDNQNPPVSMINLTELEQSSINWDEFYKSEEIKLVEKYELRPHQQGAHNGVINGLKEADRGKLILACGTGKTFTSLRIAETMAGKGKKVLFLVPSLALLSQTLNEWTQQAKIPLKNFAVCSDSDVGKRSKGDDDRVIATRSDLDFPSTTNAKSLSNAIKALHDDEHMTVVYSTYHSINVLSDAQMSHNIGEFDLIICDEAHRTTGATFDDEDESAFVMVHSDNNIMGEKRLYMTATPRIYSEDAKSTESVQLCSMDDEKLFGKELHVINFSQAVALDLLVDYKVIVLSVEESVISRRIQSLLRDEDNHLNVDDAAKIIGCWKALAKHGLYDSDDPMRRAVAFCQVIGTDYKGKAHKVSSKLISEMFSEVVETYQAAEIKALQEEDPNAIIPHSLTLKCKAEHVDGSMNASEKLAKLEWLKQDLEDNTCHILSNVRCLSEGVDVPALDAVMFLTPRQSQVDVVQSVGRVMRKSAGKKRGYVILPVVVPAGMDPADALNDNKVYKVVWQVLNALRSHDDSFDAMINKLEFNGRDTSKMEVIAVTDKVQKKSATTTGKAGQKAKGGSSIGTDSSGQQQQMAMEFEVGEIERALYAKVVKKCGNRHHWEDWANDVAKIANTHIDRIEAILENPEYEKEHKAFNAFANELRDDLNSSITDEEVVEMLAQHLITKPVFDALFEQYEFAKRNPISVAMQDLLDILESHRLDKEAKQLESFYESVKMRASGVHSAEGKQKIILELYDKFFKNAFPRITERLGIVYTPTEVVDFIIHSIENVLNDEFGASLADEGVHIIDPFTGTGTFVTRLLQSGLIPKDKLPHKYKHEIHANEIVLLAYYIACINIETVYHSTILDVDTKDNSEANEVGYTPFEGICLTDTFEMYEKGDLISELLEDNSERRKRQKALDIRVIMGNPPYSAGQGSANDNNANVAYSSLDKRIRETYAEKSKGTNKNSLYDSYIRAIRWASDRIGNKGIIGFVTNAGFIEGNTADGIRQCLAEEFSNLYIFHLRGNARTSGERRRKEKDNVFGQGTRTPIAISILVKNPTADATGQIKIHDIGDYLSQSKKLEMISEFKDLKGIAESDGWQEIIPNEFNDWINQRDPNFDNYINIGSKRDSKSKTVFKDYSTGLQARGDIWFYNYGKKNLHNNIKTSISFFNSEVERYKKDYDDLVDLKDFVKIDLKKFAWYGENYKEVANGNILSINSDLVMHSLYRPFIKSNIYFDKSLMHRTGILSDIYPKNSISNQVICLSKSGSKGFSVLITNIIPDLHLIGDSQCFPLYLYDEINNLNSESDENPQLTLTAPDEPVDDENVITDDNGKPIYRRKDAITNEGLAHFVNYYASQMSADDSISKEDLFYYIYGLLHNEEYRERYAENLTKQLPNIPRVQQYQDFVAFSNAGRKLADLHINYENLDMYQGIKFNTKLTNLKLADGQYWAKSKIEDDKFYVTKMKHPKRKNDETDKNEDDPTKIVYNNHITIEHIPEEAYDYVVNGKPAIEWIIERQSVKTDKNSGITNDANDWAIETMNNPRYPLELLLRVINVSLKTQSIVRELPKLVLEKIEG